VPTPELRETIYTPESQLLRPAALLRRMGRDLMGSRELAWRLFVRNVSARYRQTALGYLWALLPPLAATALFVLLRRSGVFSTGVTSVPYVPFLVTGLVLWQTFVDALFAPIRVVSQSKAMLVKVNFPREALILAGVAEVLFGFLIRSALLAAVLIWYRVTPPATVLIAPLGVIMLIAIGTAIGVLLAPMAALLQDVEQGLAIVISLWLFATPVLYPPPTTYPGSLTMVLNPASAVLDTTRAWLLGGAPEFLPTAGWVAAITVVVLFAGWVLYRLALPIVIERIGA
jgi:lipopolysaccharide transport system permease protein